MLTPIWGTVVADLADAVALPRLTRCHSSLIPQSTGTCATAPVGGFALTYVGGSIRSMSAGAGITVTAFTASAQPATSARLAGPSPYSFRLSVSG